MPKINKLLTLIKSISGIRGTIGGKIGDNLTPQDIVSCTAAFGHWVILQTAKPKIVVGRDARISGEMVAGLVVNTLRALGIEVVDLGLSTTPTVEMAVPAENAGGGIILTASHNPKQWNALKLLNSKGEFISAADGESVLSFIDSPDIHYAEVDKLGSYSQNNGYIRYHIDKILNLPLVKAEEIRGRKYKVVLDSVNSTGSISVAPLLAELGCEVVQINDEPNGRFAHNPEPLPEHLHDLAKAVTFHNADLGIAVDPDVDRLVFVNEDGSMFGEEYTLVAIADYVLQFRKGATVSNLSSSRALRDVTEKRGGTYFAAAVGEVNVVEVMKAQNAVIGGEGNGGIIYPDLHYGRDSLVGVALFLSYLATTGRPASFLRAKFPNYIMVKNKITLSEEHNLEDILVKLEHKYHKQPINKVDGVKIEFDLDWVHLRRSNTEPIIRIYAESSSEVAANSLVNKIKSDISDFMKEKN